MTQHLIVERPVDGLALVTLNRPDALNALSMAMRREIVTLFAQFEQVDEVRVVILTGAGRGFCAGLDLAELSADTDALASVASDDPTAAVRNFPGVVIGAINGPAVTGGLELALACDILIASETARFADTHARVGVLPGWQMSQRLSRTIGLYRAKQMSLTGMMLTAPQAESWGLIGEVTAPDQLLWRARELADAMLAMPPGMLPAYKSLINDSYAQPLEEGIAIEQQRSAVHNSQVAPEAIADRRTGIQQANRTVSPTSQEA